MTGDPATAANAAAEAGASWFDVLVGVGIPMVVVVGTIVYGIWSYRRQQRDKHRDNLRDLYSEALRAVADYQELPYLVRRRSDDSPTKPSELTWHASGVQSRLDFYVARLQLESDALGTAYEALVGVTRREAGAHMTAAWHEDRLASDADIPLGAAYPRDGADAERQRCLAVMRQHLASTPPDTSEHRDEGTS